MTAKEIAAGTVISIGENDVILIAPGDANPALGQNKKEIVDRAVRNLTLAVDEVKEWRNPRHILMAAEVCTSGHHFLSGHSLGIGPDLPVDGKPFGKN